MKNVKVETPANESEHRPFELSDIEDVRIIVKAKGKHWSILPAVDKGIARQLRIMVYVEVISQTHSIVDKALEDIVK